MMFNKTTIKAFLFFMVFLFLASTKMISQSVWPLEKCIKTAWENNLNLDNSELAIRSSKIQERQAREARYPSLSANSSLNWNFGRTIDPTSNTFVAENFFANNYSVNSGVIIFDGYKLKNGLKQSEVNTKASEKDLAQLQRDIALNVASSYLNLLFAKENLQIANNNLTISNQQLDQIRKLISAGTRAENESFDAEALVANDERALVTAKNNFDISMLQLKQLMLVDENENIDITSPENLLLETDPDLLQMNEVYQSALLTQESIRSAELRANGAELGVKIAKSQLYPRLSFGISLGTNYSNKGIQIDGYQPYIQEQQVIFNGVETTVGFPQDVPIISKKSYGNQVSDNLSYGFGFNLSVPIYSNYSIKGNVENAKLNSDRFKNDLELAKQNLKTTVQQALADARASKSAMAASEKSLTTQKKAYENSLKKYNAGTTNSFELSNQKSRLDIAELNFLISKYDYIFKAKVIDFYMGKQIKL